MNLRFIYNPIAGHARRRVGLEAALRGRLQAGGFAAALRTTRYPGHATELAREAAERGCDTVVAIGGDGTINEVAQALIGSDVALAIVPCGSGNGLAAHLGVPTRLDQALGLVTTGRGRRCRIDTGRVNGTPFLNVMGFGLDAEVAHRFNQLAQRGLPTYVRAAVGAFLRRRNERVVVRWEEGCEELTGVLFSIANSDQYGNAARIAPGARVDDGRLDLVAVTPVGWIGAAALGVRLMTGTIDRSPHVRRWPFRHLVVERARPGLIHTDGETREAPAQLDITVAPGSLWVVVPVDAPDPAPAAPDPGREPALAERRP